MRRTHLSCLQLEDRRTPAVSVFNLGGSLLITGTPEAASPPGEPAEVLSVARVPSRSGDLYRVTDGPRDLGTYRVTRGITLSLDSFDSDIQVDLAGGALRGDLTVDLGSGDRDPDTFNGVFLAGGGGTVNGSVAFRGTSSAETLAVGYTVGTFDLSPVTVRRDVTAVGGAYGGSGFELDFFALAPGSTVRGSLFANRIALTDVGGMVRGDVTALATNSSDGSYLATYGEVGGDLYFEGSTATSNNLVLLSGRVRGDATVRIAGGYTEMYLGLFGGGRVDGSLIVSTAGPTDFNFFASAVSRVGGSAVFDFSNDAGTFSSVALAATVGGSLVVNDGAGDLLLFVGDDFSGGTGGVRGVIGGGITVNAGGGTNAFRFDGAAGATAGGPVVYSGGDGADTVSITGAENTFDLFVFVGGGFDTVRFAPDARVRSAVIVFTPGGVNTWTPPDAIDFPLTLLGL